MIILLALGCTADPKTTDTSIKEANYIGILHREDGWLRGDLHIHSTHSDGYDDVATNIAIAEYLSTDEFVAFHPEYAGNGLDFISLTDHRTISQQSDVDYTSSQLILIDGEEFGSEGHAGTHGIRELVEHDPAGDGTTLDDIIQAIISTHEQGGSFSPNHPFLPFIPFPWDIDTHDGIEVWNSGWALMAPEMSQTQLTEWEEANGVASASYKRAVQTTGQLASMQALTWYEALLSRGKNAALIGGSDRHLVLPIGFPTTWVHVDNYDQKGVVQGIQNGRTSVSRTPVSAQVDIAVELNGGTYYMGDEIPLSESAATATIRIRVGRANGGLLWVKYGSAVASDSDLATAPLGVVLREEHIDDDDFTLEWSQEVQVGDWFYPIVLDPLVVAGTSEEEAVSIRELATSVAVTGEEDFLGLANLFTDLVETEVLFDGGECRPDRWSTELFQCLPPDQESFGSFFVPDKFDRALNVFVENGEITDWSMGAIGSAVLFVIDEGQ